MNLENPIKNYLDLFIITSLNHMCIRSCRVSQPNNKLISNGEQLLNATDLLPITFGIIFSLNPHGKTWTNTQISPRTTDESRNSEVCTIKILLDSGVSALIVRKDVLYKHHKILKDRKNKLYTIAGLFNTTFVIEIIYKLSELNHTAKNLRKMTIDRLIIKSRFDLS